MRFLCILMFCNLFLSSCFVFVCQNHGYHLENHLKWKTLRLMNWNFLLVFNEKMGLGKKWVGWMRWCMSLASFLAYWFLLEFQGPKTRESLLSAFIYFGYWDFLSPVNKGKGRRFCFWFLDGKGWTRGIWDVSSFICWWYYHFFFCEARVEQLKYLNWTSWGNFWVRSQYGERVNSFHLEG